MILPNCILLLHNQPVPLVFVLAPGKAERTFSLLSVCHLLKSYTIINLSIHFQEKCIFHHNIYIYVVLGLHTLQESYSFANLYITYYKKIIEDSCTGANTVCPKISITHQNSKLVSIVNIYFPSISLPPAPTCFCPIQMISL